MEDDARDLRFKEEVERVWREKGWRTLREAEYATHIERTALFRMRTGPIPTRAKVIEWAEGIGESINYWLELAGHPPIPEALVAKPAVSVPPAVTQAISAAPSREEKIEEAFRFVRSDRTYQFGAGIMGSLPTEAKLGIVRLYEELKHVRLLPPEVM